MNHVPEISVIIPAYNHERYVGKAISSVLNQSLADLELIVIDDGSTDGTYSVIQSFADPRIKALTQSNQDAYNTLNRGLELARGQYIAILNSDDLYTTDRLEKMRAFISSHELTCAISDIQPINARGREISNPRHYWQRWHSGNKAFYANSGELHASLLHGNLMVTSSNLFMTREAAQTVGGFAPLRYLHDYDYILRMAQTFEGRVGFLNEKLLKYRLHRGSTLTSGLEKATLEDIDVIKGHIDQLDPVRADAAITVGSERLRQLRQNLETLRAEARNPLRRIARVMKSELKARLTTPPS